MVEDDVLQGVRTAREAYAQSHGYDLKAMVADLREQDDRGDWPVVCLAPRRPLGPAVSHFEPNPTLRPTRPAAGADPDS